MGNNFLKKEEVKGPVEEPIAETKAEISTKVEEPVKTEKVEKAKKSFKITDVVTINADKDYNNFEISEKAKAKTYVVLHVFGNGNCLVARDEDKFILDPKFLNKA